METSTPTWPGSRSSHHTVNCEEPLFIPFSYARVSQSFLNIFRDALRDLVRDALGEHIFRARLPRIAFTGKG